MFLDGLLAIQLLVFSAVAMDTDNELQLSFVLSNRYGNGILSLYASVINKLSYPLAVPTNISISFLEYENLV
jgi:hypothetical protein